MSRSTGPFMSGPPFVNPLHNEIEADRDPGSPAWLPKFENGRTVQFTSSGSQIDAVIDQRWGPVAWCICSTPPTRSCFFNQKLAFEDPEWLVAGQRGPTSPSR